MTRKQLIRKYRDGLPIDAKDWTEADWRDLHEAVEKTKTLIRERHMTKEQTKEVADKSWNLSALLDKWREDELTLLREARDRLAAERDVLRGALRDAEPIVCGQCCPSVKNTGESWTRTHCELCQRIKDALK